MPSPAFPRPRCARLLVALLAVGALAGVVGCSGTESRPTAPSPARSPDATGSTDTTDTGRDESAATTTATEPPAPPSSAPRFHPTPVVWRSCGRNQTQCAEVEVPRDYEHPDDGLITLAVRRLPAREPANRIGSLFFNPGGPGASGNAYLDTLAGAMGDDVRNRFDLVTWDPRGVGGSSPLGCDDGVLDFYKTDLDQVDPPPDVEAAAKHAADRCASTAGNLLPFMGTKDVARDLDTLREAVGDERLNYYGVSYGSLIGLEYAELFPKNIRAMIVDGIVDPTVDPFEATLQQSIAVDKVIDAFIAWCKAEDSCPLRPDPGAAIDEMRQLAKRGALRGQLKGKSTVLSPTHVGLGIALATYDETMWPRLAAAVRTALDGDGSAIAAMTDAYLGEASMGANNAVGCADARRPSDRDLDDLARRSAQVAPRSGVFNANFNRVCEYWPASRDPLDSALDTEGAPPILVFGTTGDNATPYENAVHVAKLLPGARLVTLDGTRHAAFGANRCVMDAQSAYLIDLALPPSDERC